MTSEGSSNERSQSVISDHMGHTKVVPPIVDPAMTKAEIISAPATKLVFYDGPLIQSVKVFTIFWGSAWNAQEQTNLAKRLNDFFKFIVASELIDQLAEYNIPQRSFKINHGEYLGTTTITDPPTPTVVMDSMVQHVLQQQIAGNHNIPQPSADTLYFIYLPPGVAAVGPGGERSCGEMCGYHFDIGSRIFYAVMPYPTCQSCVGDMNLEDALTCTSSHELCEAITDAVPGSGWYDQLHGEIGDICAWQTKKLGQFTVQQEWSNKNNKCV
jgi:hypothetical protein